MPHGRVLYVDRHPARFGEFLRSRRDAELVVLVPRRMPAPLRALLRQMGDARGTVSLHLARGCRKRRDDGALVHFWEWAHAEQLWFSDDLEALGFRVCPDARDGVAEDEDAWVCTRPECAACCAFARSAAEHGVYLE